MPSQKIFAQQRISPSCKAVNQLTKLFSNDVNNIHVFQTAVNVDRWFILVLLDISGYSTPVVPITKVLHWLSPDCGETCSSVDGHGSSYFPECPQNPIHEYDRKCGDPKLPSRTALAWGIVGI